LFITVLLFVFVTTPHIQRLILGRPFAIEEEATDEQLSSERVGEKITYDVMMGKMRLGSAYYHHLKKTQLHGRTVNLITFVTDIIRFHDLEVIYSDPKTYLPLLIERKVSKLMRPEKIWEDYDQKNFTLTITKKRFLEKKSTIEKDAPIHNSILLPYYVRSVDKLEIGWSFIANLPQRKYKISLVSIEDIEVPAGKFRAYYFESEPKQIRIWVSADAKRVPLKVEGTGALGYKLLMREYGFDRQ